MKSLPDKKRHKFNGQEGIGMPELVIVLLIISILAVLALPQILSSRRLFRFSGMQREVVTLLRETRQEAMSQRKPITFQYQDNQKKIIIYGGVFGSLGDSKNKVYELANSGVANDDIVYGRPVFAPVAALSDGTNLTVLTSEMIEVTFQPDGSVVDASDNPEDFALFFYHKQHQKNTAFAVSILGAGGRVKLWRYSQGVNVYVE
jgi:Tfp pilus assembly protein FimT